MIRINLLPVKAAHRKSVGIRQLVLMGIVAAAVALILIGYNVKLSVDIDKQQETIANIKAEIKRLEELIGEVNELEADKKRLLKQLDVIRELEKGKTGPVRMLDALATAMPKRVWITSFSESDKLVKLEGYGIENVDISDFMNALEASNLFHTIHLKESVAEKMFGQTVYKFALESGVKYN